MANRSVKNAPSTHPTKEIQTRFGKISYSEDHQILFERGLYGFSHCKNFVIVTIPTADPLHFQLLHCLDVANVSFVLTPLGGKDQLSLGPQDIQQACERLNVAMEEITLYAITTIRDQAPGVFDFSLNLQAPVIIHSGTQRGWQYILETNYPVQYIISNPGEVL